jgi:hypothetical protein
MKNERLLQLLESVLGKSKPTSGNNVAFFSPFTSHHKPKLEINISTDVNSENPWHCWISERKGRTIHSLFKQLNLTPDYFKQLDRIISIAKYNTTTDQTQKSEVILQLPAEYKPLWLPQNTPDYRNAIFYLKQRSVTIFDIIRYRIGYCETGPYSGKIIIPSYDASGQLNYFVSRAFYKADTQKHKNPNVSKDIIGFELLINWNEPIILCEGAFDAIAIKRNAIPLFGKIIQPELRKKIIEQHVRDIYICLDPDAIKNALTHCERFMAEGLNVYLVELPAGKDASDLGFQKITSIISNTESMNFEKLMKHRMDLLWV